MRGAFCISILVTSLVTGCDFFQEQDVLYDVAGDAEPAIIRAQYSGGVTEQYSVEYLDWVRTRTCVTGEQLYVSVESFADSGTIDVGIEVEGETVDSAQASGYYATATASATCP